MACAVPCSPGPSVAGVTARFATPSRASSIFTFVSVTFPVFVTVNVYVIPCPTALYASGLALFTTATAGCATSVWLSPSLSLTPAPLW